MTKKKYMNQHKIDQLIKLRDNLQELKKEKAKIKSKGETNGKTYTRHYGR